MTKPGVNPKLTVAVVILGHESGGIRRFLLNQFAHAASVGLDFEYVCLQEGPLHDALREAGAKTTVIGGFVPTVYPHGPLLAFARWLLPGGGFAATRRALRNYFAQNKPEVIYSHFLHTHIVSARAARKTRIPVIGQVHGTLNVRRLFGLTRIAYSLALAWSLDTVVMVSETARKSLWGPARRKARMIYNAVDVQAIERRVAGAVKTPGRAIIVGRLGSGKKIDLAIRALPQLLAVGIDCTLEIVGGPTDDSSAYFRRLTEDVAVLGLQDRVVFTGPIDPPYAPLAAAEVCVNCSTVEGLPLAVIEAMICKTPVVVADCGAPAELVEHERTGLHFRADDPAALAAAVRRLLTDEPLRTRLADSACRYARQMFDITVHMRAIRALFDECRTPAEGGPRPPDQSRERKRLDP
jgi:glycosyltransferase involved in cell wall biosynthesis